MGDDKFKLDEDGTCGACNKLSLRGESVQCHTCKGLFHVACESAQGDDKVATKTTITNFLQPSTKDNFVFFCDRCLTEMEIRSTETEASRVTALEKRMIGVDQKLADILTLLNAKNSKSTDVPTSNE